jgi:hypothetical protein
MRRHQSDVMPKALKLADPVMRAATRLYPHPTRRP